MKKQRRKPKHFKYPKFVKQKSIVNSFKLKDNIRDDRTDNEIIITEVMYNPPSDLNMEDLDYEFIEIYNISDHPVDVTDWEITTKHADNWGSDGFGDGWNDGPTEILRFKF